MSTVSHRSGRYASPVISADLGTEPGKPRSAATALAPASAGADADTSQPSEPFTFIPQAVRLVVSRLRGRAVQTSAPMTRKELGRFCFCNRILYLRGERRRGR